MGSSQQAVTRQPPSADSVSRAPKGTVTQLAPIEPPSLHNLPNARKSLLFREAPNEPPHRVRSWLAVSYPFDELLRPVIVLRTQTGLGRRRPGHKPVVLEESDFDHDGSAS